MHMYGNNQHVILHVTRINTITRKMYNHRDSFMGSQMLPFAGDCSQLLVGRLMGPKAAFGKDQTAWVLPL